MIPQIQVSKPLEKNVVCEKTKVIKVDEQPKKQAPKKKIVLSLPKIIKNPEFLRTMVKEIQHDDSNLSNIIELRCTEKELKEHFPQLVMNCIFSKIVMLDSPCILSLIKEADFCRFKNYIGFNKVVSFLKTEPRDVTPGMFGGFISSLFMYEDGSNYMFFSTLLKRMNELFDRPDIQTHGYNLLLYDSLIHCIIQGVNRLGNGKKSVLLRIKTDAV
ncbi:hypothetical protein AB837_00329 [bacterium AB1]|nr:hypothetical protein AB837_00329 [bacterium AB1]